MNAASIFNRMGLTVPLAVLEASLQMNNAVSKNIPITKQDMIDSWKMARVVIDQHIIHPHRTNEAVFSYKTNEQRHIELLKRKVSTRIIQIMSATRDITPFERTQPIDCDIMEFFSLFGHLKKYLYKANRRPRKVNKDHIRKITNAHEFEDVLGYPPPVKYIPKKNAECRLMFPLIIYFKEEESVAQMDIQFRVYNRTTGSEIVKRKMKSSGSLSTKMVKELLAFK